MVKSNRLGAYPWLKDENSYTYKRVGAYKPSKLNFKHKTQLLFITKMFFKNELNINIQNTNYKHQHILFRHEHKFSKHKLQQSTFPF